MPSVGEPQESVKPYGSLPVQLNATFDVPSVLHVAVHKRRCGVDDVEDGVGDGVGVFVPLHEEGTVKVKGDVYGPILLPEYALTCQVTDRPEEKPGIV